MALYLSHFSSSFSTQPPNIRQIDLSALVNITNIWHQYHRLLSAVNTPQNLTYCTVTQINLHREIFSLCIADEWISVFRNTVQCVLNNVFQLVTPLIDELQWFAILRDDHMLSCIWTETTRSAGCESQLLTAHLSLSLNHDVAQGVYNSWKSWKSTGI